MDTERARPRVFSSWPLILLLIGIGVMAGVAFEAYRAVRSQQQTVQEVLRDYMAFASWSLERHVAEELDAAFWTLLNPVNHGEALHTSPQIPPPAVLAHYLPWDSAGCYCHRADYSPTAFLAITLGADTMAVAANRHVGPQPGVRVVSIPAGLRSQYPEVRDMGPPRRLSARERGALVGRLTEHARTTYRPERRVALLTHATGAGHSLVGYTLMPTVWGDTLLYAAELAPATARRLFDDVLDDKELLPEAFTRERSNRAVLVAEVADAAGNVLYRSEPGPYPDEAVTERLAAAQGSLAVRAAIRPEVASSLVIGGLPRSHLPFLLAVFALACGLAIVGAVQVRRAGELARLRSGFVASVSHELRTPLTQIRMYLQTLRLGRYATKRQREWLLENADRESTRLVSLVENVLEFATGGRRPKPVDDDPPVDVALATRRAVAAYRPLAAYRRTRIEVDEADVPAWSRITPTELRQVLYNLLDNATKYGPAGQTVHVECRTAPDADAVRIGVSDEGPGVPPRERSTIWEPFHRTQDAAEGAVGGSGIGLAVVREIVERHGGRAWVEDAPDRGARFVVTLPRSAAPPEPREPGAGRVVVRESAAGAAP